MPHALPRKLVLAALAGALLAAAIRTLRGDPAPQFAGHGPIGAGTDRPELVAAPVDPTVAPQSASDGDRPHPDPAGSSPPPVQPTLDLRLVTDPDAPTPIASIDDRWAEPVDDECPAGFPVKANLTSGIFHVPGGLSYDRTHPDRCYRTAQGAEADGLRAAKR